MEEQTINNINEQVFKQFPYLKGAPPVITNNPDGSLSFRYKGQSKTESGFTIPLSIKVKVSENGEILQIASSR
jgi:hypothetical protein